MKSSSQFGHVAFVLLVLHPGFFATAQVRPAAPKVIATQPRNGDQRVAPELREIVITFDQDMDAGGYSFTGGGVTFPKVTGKPLWRTARECVLPVQLENDHAYDIGINGATKRNFKSKTGLPVSPIVLTFKTVVAGGNPGGASASSEKQVEAVRQLRQAIEQRYSYRDVHVMDWTAAWREFEPRLLAAKQPREFAVIAGEMLAGAQDAHIWLIEGGEIVPAFRRTVTPNVNIQLLPRLIAGWSQKHPMVAVGEAAQGVGYIIIHSWEKKHEPQLIDAAFAALGEVRNLPALIVDVRMNAGGDEALARQFAGCFVRQRKLYARHADIDPSSATGFSAPVDRWLEPTSTRPAYAGRVAVLMGRVNMSSAEAFLLMMKQVPDSKLVGERSYGASGNPKPHELANGVTVYLPSWKALLPDGTSQETKGIAPDVEVMQDASTFPRRDLVIEKAIDLLKR